MIEAFAVAVFLTAALPGALFGAVAVGAVWLLLNGYGVVFLLLAALSCTAYAVVLEVRS